MKYWKGIGKKSGLVGTMDDDGSVPESIEATKEEYDIYVADLPGPQMNPTKEAWSMASTVDEKLNILAERLGIL